MKTLFTALIFTCWMTFSAGSLMGQTGATSTTPGQIIQAVSTPYQVVAADGNSAVWQRTDVSGGVPQPHSYVQLEAGMNHLVDGQWVPSTENIQIMPDGTAAATNGQHQVYFLADIYESAITVITPGGQTLQSRPALLIYTDGNEIQVLGQLRVLAR